MKRTVLTSVALVVASAAFGQTDMKMNMFGGPVYDGSPALGVTASLVKAGGGAGNFSIATALVNMVGQDNTNAEVAKLTRQYGKKRVDRFIAVFNFAVADALNIATAAGVTLPEPTMSGTDLASTLVKAGEDSKGVFWTGYLLDKAVSHDIHMQVMADIEKKWDFDADKDYHRISNQAHYDLAKALNVSGVRLAPLH